MFKKVTLTMACLAAAVSAFAADAPAAAKPAAPAVTAEKKIFFQCDFKQKKWSVYNGVTKAVDKATGKKAPGKAARATVVDGPTAGSKALKIQFKFEQLEEGWPQVQFFMPSFLPQGEFILEFDLKVEHVANNVNMSIETVPFSSTRQINRLPFVDDGVWKNVKLRYVPIKGKENVKVDRLCFTANAARQKAGDETIYTIANLKVYSAK